MRSHGHRAAKIDPLDLIHREEVAALFPQRYGLFDYAEKFNVNGILWTRRLGEPGEGELWSLKQIEDHLRKIYVGNIAYEVRSLSAYIKSNVHCVKVYAFSIKDGASVVFPSSRVSYPPVTGRYSPLKC